MILDRLSPSTLRHLALAMEARDPRLNARHQLTGEGVERLAENSPQRQLAHYRILAPVPAGATG